MDFELNEEQQMFRDVLRKFVNDEIKPVAREMEQSGQYPTEIVAQLAELGLFGITVGTDYGGLDLDTVSMSLVFEEISMGWMGIAGILGSHSLSCRMLTNHGTPSRSSAGCRSWPRGSAAPASPSPSRARAATCRASPPGHGARATPT